MLLLPIKEHRVSFKYSVRTQDSELHFQIHPEENRLSVTIMTLKRMQLFYQFCS